jgi:mercuric reductase
MSMVPRAGAVLETRGIIKMTANADSNEVLAVAMVGLNAGEVIHEATMAMRYRVKVHNFIDLLHVFRRWPRR